MKPALHSKHTCPFFTFALIVVALSIGLLLSPSTARAQMVTGSDIPGFGQVFHVAVRPDNPPITVLAAGCTVPGNILWPGDRAQFTFVVSNHTSAAIVGPGKVDIVNYGTRGRPDDVWKPDMVKFGDVGSVPINMDIPANGSQTFTVAPVIPARFGAYGLVADTGAQGGRAFVTSCVRTFKAVPGAVQYPKLGMDVSDPDILYRLGGKSIRIGIGFKPTTDSDYEAWYQRQAAQIKQYQKANVSLILEFGAGGPQLFGDVRRWLDDKDVQTTGGNDRVWLPEYDTQFKAMAKRFVTEFGWPRGPVTAVKFMNEPWEGDGISGWGADMTRYMEIYTQLANAVMEARKESGVKVLIGGCDSSSNTFDKLFADGTAKNLPLLDFVSVHYQGMFPPSTVKMWHDRTGPYGRVKIWDTESWIANCDDRVAAVLATNMSTGHDRAVGIYGGDIGSGDDVNVPDPGAGPGKTKRVHTNVAWSVAASVGAAQHFLGERNFKELLFKNGLPWVMVFNGLPVNGVAQPEDGTVVVVGDIGDEFGHDNVLFRTARGLAEIAHKSALRTQLANLPATATDTDRQALIDSIQKEETLSGASMTVSDLGGRVRAYDFYGNPVAATNGKLVVPLDQRGFYLRGDGKPGSFAALLGAIKTSHVDGLEPVAPVCHDLTAPVGQGGKLRISLTNILNRPVSGDLAVSLGRLVLTPKAENVVLKANETRDIVFGVSGAPDQTNTYPLDLKYDAGRDGSTVWEENMHVNVIAHKTIDVDGDLSDWDGVLPQTVTTSGSFAPTVMEAAWNPHETFDTSAKQGLATGYMAYDSKYFYFAAKIADSTPDPGMLRYETMDDSQFFYPPVAYKRDDSKTLEKTDATWSTQIDEQLLPHALVSPDGATRSQAVWESTARAFAIDLSLPTDHATQFSLYFLDWDDAERRSVTIQMLDHATGKVLDERSIQHYGHGRYVVYRLSGNIRVVVRTNSFWPADLSGYFFDPVAGDNAAQGTSASFVAYDNATGGDWRTHYGAAGYNVFGSPEKLPANATVAAADEPSLTPLVWPAGVRRFAYRKAPDLPCGCAPNHDNVQIAFNVIPPDKKDWYPFPPGTMPGYIGYKDTDYEYALNPVAAQYGGGTEIWRLQHPGMPHKHFYARQPKSPMDGPVKSGKLVIRRDATTRYVECAIPWSEIPDVKKKLDANQPIKFSFRVNDNAGVGCLELSRGRSVAKHNGSFEADWVEHWANEVEFGWGK
jgi:hypothetical protein